MDAFRKKRNVGDYERVGLTSPKEANELRDIAKNLRDRVRSWIEKSRPELLNHLMSNQRAALARRLERGNLDRLRLNFGKHKVAWRCDTKIALPPIFGVLITQRIGPFTLRREYVAPGS